MQLNLHDINSIEVTQKTLTAAGNPFLVVEIKLKNSKGDDFTVTVFPEENYTIFLPQEVLKHSCTD